MITAENIVIAVGGRPRFPENVGTNLLSQLFRIEKILTIFFPSRYQVLLNMLFQAMIYSHFPSHLEKRKIGFMFKKASFLRRNKHISSIMLLLFSGLLLVHPVSFHILLNLGQI
jgi:hypothetical protein